MTISTDEVWRDFSLPLKRFISNRVPDPQDAEDVLQDVFTKIHNSAGSLADDSKTHAWVYRITRNAITDYHRKKGRVELVQLAGDLAQETTRGPSPGSEISACLRPMINNLPEKYKEAILLTGFQNLSQKELSRRTGLSLSGAKSRVQRGRQKLREMLLDCCHLEFDCMGNIIDYEHRGREYGHCQGLSLTDRFTQPGEPEERT